MNEKKQDILEKIVANDGSCTNWANKKICEVCPMSKLKKRNNGSYYSCFEAVGAINLSEEEADKKYKEVAMRILMDESIEDMLIEESDGSQ